MPKNILIIDDSRLSREMMQMTVEQAGYGAEGAADASEAMVKLQEKQFDLILLDLILPGIDGFTFLEMLRNFDKFKDVPVVVLSGRDSKEEKERVRQFGVTAYIVKHLAKPADVIKTIKSIIN